MVSHIGQCFLLKNLLSKLSNGLKLTTFIRNFSNEEVSQAIRYKNDIFTRERARQIESVGRIEKITVKLSGPPEDVVVYMNQNLSTPFDCARHMKEHIQHRAALALVDSELWDMHRPLTSTCKVEFLYFDSEDPSVLNNVFWESCSIILGAVICNAFKDSVSITPHSYPPANIQTGSFVYDAKLSLEDWKPTEKELRILRAEMLTFCKKNHKFERLEVDKEIALEIMHDNPFKKSQLMSSDFPGNKVTLYRVGNHIEICNGPLIANTSFINDCSVTAVHQIETDCGILYRFQGVALPKPLRLNQVAVSFLEKRAKKLNPGRFPMPLAQDLVSSGLPASLKS